MDNSNRNKDSYYAFFAFLIWPFLALLAAFQNFKKPWAVNIMWAFIAFYGFTLAIGSESESSDIVRYVAEYQALHQVEMNFSSALEYFQESGEVDVLRTFIAISLSRFTESQATLTLIYGIIFGFFFSRNMWYVMERLKGNLQPITVLLVICFFLIIPIWNLGGFRMWTAAHIFFYGLIPFLFEGDKSKIWASCASVLVHYSFVVPIAVFLCYLIFGNRLTIFFCFYLATFFISEIDISAFNNFVETYAPEALQERSESYRRVDSVEDYRTEGGTDASRWYAVWYSSALSWSVMGFLVILYISGRTFFKDNINWLRLSSFTFLFFAVANLFSSLPSGGRYVAVANLFAVALIIFYVQNRPEEKIMKRFIPLAMPALMLYIVVQMRSMLYMFSVTTFMGNPIIAFFTTGENISLNDVMRMLL